MTEAFKQGFLTKLAQEPDVREPVQFKKLPSEGMRVSPYFKAPVTRGNPSGSPDWMRKSLADQVRKNISQPNQNTFSGPGRANAEAMLAAGKAEQAQRSFQEEVDQVSNTVHNAFRPDLGPAWSIPPKPLQPSAVPPLPVVNDNSNAFVEPKNLNPTIPKGPMDYANEDWSEGNVGGGGAATTAGQMADWGPDSHAQQGFMDRLKAWASQNRKPLMYGGAALAGAGGLYALYKSYQAQKEREEDERMRRRMMFKGASAFELGALERLDSLGMSKVADRLVNEYIKGIPGGLALSLVPGGKAVGGIANLGGLISGVTDEKDKMKENNRDLEWVPGVSSRRQGQRLKLVTDASERGGGRSAGSNMLTELIGGYTAPLGGALVGAGVGSALGGGLGTLGGAVAGGAAGGGKGALGGAALGGLGGMGLGTAIGAGVGATAGLSGRLIAAVLAAARRRRSIKDQAGADFGNHALSNLLIPGVGDYNRYKRWGASRNLIEDKEKTPAKGQGPKVPLPPVTKKPITQKKAQATTLRTPAQAAATTNKLGPATRASVMQVPEVAKTVGQAGGLPAVAHLNKLPFPVASTIQAPGKSTTFIPSDPRPMQMLPGPRQDTRLSDIMPGYARVAQRVHPGLWGYKK